MEQKENKSFHQTMRALHRDLGFLTIGFVIIYALSGIILIYRDTDLLKQDITVERMLPANLNNEEIARELRIRDFQVVKTEGETIYFQNGSYNVATGQARFTMKEIIPPFNKFIDLHKTASGKNKHWVTTIFGILLLFMAISSLWMYKPENKYFKRGMIFAGIGILISVMVLLL